MPTTFHDREQAFEAKFAHDEEFRFLALARRDKLFARWVAQRLGLPVEATDALVKAVLAIPNGRGHDQTVVQHAAAALSEHGRQEDLATILERCMQDARAQLIAEPRAGS